MEELKQKIQEKRKNARLYPIYKMCSWDLLFYYAIAFVFLTQTKGMNVASVMLTDAIYPVFKIIFQIPGLTIIDKIGKRGSLMLGNFLLSLSIITLIFSNGIPMVILSYAFMGFAFSIKNVAESNLLYDSVTSRKGKGMFTFLEEKGARNYYYLDGISSLCTGFLFVINGYIPMAISLGFTIIAIAISSCFKEVYETDQKNIQSFRTRIKEYGGELKSAFGFIFKSRRLQAIMVFSIFFYGLIYTSYTLREGLLTELGLQPQYFAMIIATLTIVSGFASKLQNPIQKKFKNRTFTFIAIVYILTFIVIGTVCLTHLPWLVTLFLVLVMYAIQYAMQAPYHILHSNYLKSFASPEMRIKIASTFDLINSVSSFAVAFLTSYLLAITTAEVSFLFLGIAFAIIIFLVLRWMKERFGLKPEQYRKQDIEYEEKVLK